MTRMFLCLITFLLLELHFRLAKAHGNVQGPFQARNVIQGHYCPHCANGKGVCGEGGQWEATQDASDVDGKYTTALHELTAGDLIDVSFWISVAHQGIFTMELCRPTGPKITNECFTTRLERDPEDNRYSPYLKDYPDIFWFEENACVQEKLLKARFRVPDSFGNCDHCILRWFWQTGNSCCPHPAVSQKMHPELAAWNNNGCTIPQVGHMSSCGVNCPHAGCGAEHYKNCIDVQLNGSEDVEFNKTSTKMEDLFLATSQIDADSAISKDKTRKSLRPTATGTPTSEKRNDSQSTKLSELLFSFKLFG